MGNHLHRDGGALREGLPRTQLDAPENAVRSDASRHGADSGTDVADCRERSRLRAAQALILSESDAIPRPSPVLPPQPPTLSYLKLDVEEMCMLSISPLSGGDQGYYLKLTNTAYYTEGGEPPGQWYGLGAREFGLSGTVQQEHLERLCNGFDHLTGEKALVQNAGVLDGKKARKPGDDMTFRADKTVSALFAVADPELRDAIRQAHLRAVKAALDLAQDVAGKARCGRDGQRHEFAPLAWCLFEHCMSRSRDPQLHTHALLINLTRLENGKTRTVDSTHIYHWQMAMGSLYRAELARGMQRLGFEVEQVEQGSSIFFRVKGVPEGCSSRSGASAGRRSRRSSASRSAASTAPRPGPGRSPPSRPAGRRTRSGPAARCTTSGDATASGMASPPSTSGR